MRVFLLQARVAVSACAAMALVCGTAPRGRKEEGEISTIVEVPQLVETKDGVHQGARRERFRRQGNIEVDYQTANGNMSTQQQIAKKFVGEGADLIVAITTPTAQAMATCHQLDSDRVRDVTDPMKAKLIPQFKAPGGNITGVSDAPPLAAQLALFREIVPNLKKLGFIYNPGLDSSNATLGWAAGRGRQARHRPSSRRPPPPPTRSFQRPSSSSAMSTRSTFRTTPLWLQSSRLW